VTDRQRYFYRAVADPNNDSPLKKLYTDQMKKRRAGYLKRTKTGWEIQPARKLGKDWYYKVKEAQIDKAVEIKCLDSDDYVLQYYNISFSIKEAGNGKKKAFIDVPGKHEQHGCLVMSGNMHETNHTRSVDPDKERKNHAVVGPEDENAKPLKIDENAIEDYRASLTDFQRGMRGGKPIEGWPFHEEWGLFKTQDGQWAEDRVVFYCEPRRGEAITLFGHSPNFRVPYRFRGAERAASPADFVPDELKDKAITDIAEAIFGYVLPDKEHGQVKTHGRPQALAGRVFVDDAHCRQHRLLSEKPIAPRILSSPKPTTFQHYLVQPEARKSALRHYASTPVEETVIRGHKLYWHQGGVEREEIEDQEYAEALAKGQERDTQHTEMKPLAPGATFDFTVRFENLSDVELGALLWVLDLTDAGKQHGKEYRLKLGMGKPLGMGAVKIAYALELDDREQRYRRLFTADNNAWSEPRRSDDPEVVRQQALVSFHAYVLEHSGEHSLDGAIDGTLRIQMMLVLLSWPGPLPVEQFSRYMEIERRQEPHIGNDPNEYKDRPVLPTPLQVAEMSGGLQGYNGDAPAAKGRSSTHPPRQSGLVRRINALSKADPDFGGKLAGLNQEREQIDSRDPNRLAAARAIQAKIREVGLEEKYSRRGWYKELLKEIAPASGDERR
jgi:CRISPR-associated protein (TIGR03986 family)